MNPRPPTPTPTPLTRRARAPATGHSVHIERLVIAGAALTPLQGRQLQVAIQRELARLLMASAALGRRSGAAVAELGAGSVAASPADPGGLGLSVAATLARALESGP